MADQIKISIVGLDKLKRDLLTFRTELEKKVSAVIAKGAQKIVTLAKQNTPVDEGILRNSISADLSKPFEVHITVNAPYAAPVEFGTGKYAAEYVSTLPDNWQAFAAQFRGKGGGSFEEFVRNIAAWIHRKSIFADTAIHGSFSVKTRKRTGNNINNLAADYALAYVIARSILIKGIHPHPYLFPAYKATAPEIIEGLRQIFLKA